MQTQVHFDDRLLICSDCSSEFVFTAGEQLFFHDKQFKNDPKRCKPCKSRRSGLSAAASGTGPVAAGISRTETRTECSDCGIQTTVPFKPTQGRPVLCRQCFQVKSKSIPAGITVPAAQPSAYIMSEAGSHEQTVSALTAASIESTGMMLSPEAAALAATSMAGAPANSSIATTADLASILETHAGTIAPMVPVTLLSTQEATAAELLAAIEAAKA